MMIFGLAVKHLTGSLWSELLQSRCVPRGPPSSRRSRTCDQKAPTKGCGSSWKTGSLLHSCLHFKCFSTCVERLQDVPEHRTAFGQRLWGLHRGAQQLLRSQTAPQHSWRRRTLLCYSPMEKSLLASFLPWLPEQFHPLPSCDWCAQPSAISLGIAARTPSSGMTPNNSMVLAMLPEPQLS